MEKKTFECGGRKATLFGSEQSDAPLIILNNYAGDGTSVFEAMREISTPECHLLVIGDLNWDHDMSPCVVLPANLRKRHTMHGRSGRIPESSADGDSA